MVTLNPREPLRDHRSTAQNESFFVSPLLDPLIAKTRKLLSDALDQRFFKRYTDCGARFESSFAFEDQLLLQPQFKNLDASLAKIARFCNAQQGGNAEACNCAFDNVKRRVLDKVRKAMKAIAQRKVRADPAPRPLETEVDVQSAFSEGLLMFIGSTVEAAPTVDINESRVEEELQC